MPLTWVTGKSMLHGRHNSFCAGFTLIELMVVLAILVLCASLIPLSANRLLPGRRVAVATQRIADSIHEAQAASLAMGRPVDFLVQQHALIISIPNGVDARIVPQSVVLPAATTLTLLSSDSPSAKEFSVYPDGGTSGTTISITDGTRQGRVTISALTGRVSYERDRR